MDILPDPPEGLTTFLFRQIHLMHPGKIIGFAVPGPMLLHFIGVDATLASYLCAVDGLPEYVLPGWDVPMSVLTMTKQHFDYVAKEQLTRFGHEVVLIEKIEESQ